MGKLLCHLEGLLTVCFGHSGGLVKQSQDGLSCVVQLIHIVSLSCIFRGRCKRNYGLRLVPTAQLTTHFTASFFTSSSSMVRAHALFVAIADLSTELPSARTVCRHVSHPSHSAIGGIISHRDLRQTTTQGRTASLDRERLVVAIDNARLLCLHGAGIHSDFFSACGGNRCDPF